MYTFLSTVNARNKYTQKGNPTLVPQLSIGMFPAEQEPTIMLPTGNPNCWVVRHAAYAACQMHSLAVAPPLSSGPGGYLLKLRQFGG